MLVTIEFDSIRTSGKIEIIRALANCNILAKIAKHEDFEIRAEVARNENTRVDILRRLAEDNDIDVLMAVARNKNTPADILDKLADCNFRAVQEEVAFNLNTSSDKLENIVKRAERKTDFLIFQKIRFSFIIISLANFQGKLLANSDIS